MHYHPMEPSPTLVRAWVNAAIRLRDGGPLWGLMLHILEPCRVDPNEIPVIAEIDRLLQAHDCNSVATVSNTIFPASLDRGDGIKAMTERYLPIFKRRMKGEGWGRYFERLVAWKSGKGGTVNQVSAIIEMLAKTREEGARFWRHRYELSLFDPARDLKKATNRQCLSFIELKPDDAGRLHMMAVYRNHYYVQKTLGNLIGLGRLLAFIARESGFETGTLTIQSTHAELEVDAWKKSDVMSLVDTCQGLLLKQAA